jgi:hypothetical protein
MCASLLSVIEVFKAIVEAFIEPDMFQVGGFDTGVDVDRDFEGVGSHAER